MPGWQPPPAPAATTFREYVLRRKYDFGRGRAASWAFITFARGDEAFPDAGSWQELCRYLAAVRPDLIAGARSVWRSFTAHRSQMRRRERP